MVVRFERFKTLYFRFCITEDDYKQNQLVYLLNIFSIGSEVNFIV